jgi:hypothetical protein
LYGRPARYDGDYCVAIYHAASIGSSSMIPSRRFIAMAEVLAEVLAGGLSVGLVTGRGICRRMRPTPLLAL